jgi:hypothetical protein
MTSNFGLTFMFSKMKCATHQRNTIFDACILLRLLEGAQMILEAYIP